MDTVCRMKSFCWGYSLRTKSLIVAIVDLIASLTVFIHAIYFLTDINNTEENQNENQDQNYWPTSRFTISRFPEQNELFSEEDELFPEIVFLAVVSIAVILSDIFLFMGIWAEKLKPVAASVWNAFAISCLTVMVIIRISVAYRKASGSWKIIIFAACYLGFKVFFTVVIRRYAETLKGGGNYFNGVQATVHQSTLPEAYPNGHQPLFSNVNVQKTVYPNGQARNLSEQPQIHLNGQPPYSSGQQQQMYPNEQPPYSIGQQHQMYANRPPPYSSVQQHQMHPNEQPPYSSGQQQQMYPNEPPPYSIG